MPRASASSSAAATATRAKRARASQDVGGDEGDFALPPPPPPQQQQQPRESEDGCFLVTVWVGERETQMVMAVGELAMVGGEAAGVGADASATSISVTDGERVMAGHAFSKTHGEVWGLFWAKVLSSDAHKSAQTARFELTDGPTPAEASLALKIVTPDATFNVLRLALRCVSSDPREAMRRFCMHLASRVCVWRERCMGLERTGSVAGVADVVPAAVPATTNTATTTTTTTTKNKKKPRDSDEGSASVVSTRSRTRAPSARVTAAAPAPAPKPAKPAKPANPIVLHNDDSPLIHLTVTPDMGSQLHSTPPIIRAMKPVPLADADEPHPHPHPPPLPLPVLPPPHANPNLNAPIAPRSGAEQQQEEEPPLPPGWIRVMSRSRPGQVAYEHLVSKTRTFVHPSALLHE